MAPLQLHQNFIDIMNQVMEHKRFLKTNSNDIANEMKISISESPMFVN